MTLISCPECSHQISDRATSCPSCGRPLNNRQVTDTKSSIQTIEKTGKKYKAIQGLGCLCAILAIFAIMAGTDSGSDIGLLMAIAAVILLIGGSLGAWWKNG